LNHETTSPSCKAIGRRALVSTLHNTPCPPSGSPCEHSSHSRRQFIDPARSFTHAVLVDKTPMPDHIPKVDEVGASSAPLTSAAFFIGDRCKVYNEDYMLCKAEAMGRGELDCLKEGRRVTRCAASVYVIALAPSTYQPKARKKADVNSGC
jgi:hypothetical protein